MLFSNAHRNNQGFTLAETAVITVIVGILATLVAPGLIRWVQQKQLDDALVSLQGALREAQTQAVRRSTTCAVLIPDGDGQTLTKSADSTNGCLLSNRTLPDGVNIISNLRTSKQISFSFRGNTTNSATIVLYSSDTTALKMRCLAISNGLGIMRTGRYSGSTASAADVTDGTCTSNQ